MSKNAKLSSHQLNVKQNLTLPFSKQNFYMLEQERNMLKITLDFLSEENSKLKSQIEDMKTTVRHNKEQLEEYVTKITNKDKGKLYRSLNHCYKFGAVVHQKQILDRIFDSKKDKQRYLDFVYKIAMKRALEAMILNRTIDSAQIQNIYVFTDEHTTATNGIYELQESLEQEFKFGTYNYNFSCHFPPIFPKIESVTVKYCNSDSNYLIRAADIVANHIYYLAKAGEPLLTEMPNHLYITHFPEL
jgi:hemerythrin-like domain-containing protein